MPGDAAVVVGIEDYTHIAAVPYATRDAAAFHDALIYTVGIPPARVRLMDRGASAEAIRQAVAEVADLVRVGGTLWVYFAGHGAASTRTGERLLLGQDVRADPGAFEERAVAVAELRDLATRGGGRAVLVLDACYTGKDRAGRELVEGGRFAVPVYAPVQETSVVEWMTAGPNEVAGHLELTRAQRAAVAGAEPGDCPDCPWR